MAVAKFMGPSKRFYFYLFLWEKEKKKKLHEEKTPWWKEWRWVPCLPIPDEQCCPSSLTEAVIYLCQSALGTVNFSSKWSIPCGQVVFSVKKGGIFYTHSGNTAADYHVNGNESLGLGFFFVNHGFPNQIFLFVPTHQPHGWKWIFFPPPFIFLLVGFLLKLSYSETFMRYGRLSP